MKVLFFILEIFLSCRSDLGGGLGMLARSPADNRPYFALIFGATLALFSLFFLEKIGLQNTEKASNRVPTLNPKTKKLATLGRSDISHTDWLIGQEYFKNNCFKHLIDAGQFLN